MNGEFGHATFCGRRGSSRSGPRKVPDPKGKPRRAALASAICHDQLPTFYTYITLDGWIERVIIQRYSVPRYRPQSPAMATAVALTTTDETQLDMLRAELKQWEKAFSAANGGRRAGRDDIKQDPTIGTF